MSLLVGHTSRHPIPEKPWSLPLDVHAELVQAMRTKVSSLDHGRLWELEADRSARFEARICRIVNINYGETHDELGTDSQVWIDQHAVIETLGWWGDERDIMVVFCTICRQTLALAEPCSMCGGSGICGTPPDQFYECPTCTGVDVAVDDITDDRRYLLD